MNPWAKAAIGGALVGARAAIPMFGLVKLGAALAMSRHGAAKKHAIRTAVQVGTGAALGAGFALLRKRVSLPKGAISGIGLGALAWAIARPLAKSSAPAIGACIAFGIVVERATR